MKRFLLKEKYIVVERMNTFLNNQKCRLKDIVDLLMDSGVGKESFNIISQGEVQRILSNSPSDRRAIFEEAAGILKYKKEKKSPFES